METAIQKSETPQALIELAIEKGASVDQLEKLLALQERWEANKARKTFLQAMSNFQAEVPTIEKKKQVKFNSTNYKYAELSEISSTIKDTLTKNRLSFRWEFEETATNIICTCIVSHNDGHSEKTTMSSASDKSGNKNDIQARGSAMTYMQRYTLIGALGLTTASEDTDGQHYNEVKKQTAMNDIDLSAKSNGKITPNIEPKAEGADLPWLSENQFQQAKQRINEGHIEVWEKTQAAFRMKKTYREELQQAYDFALNLTKPTIEVSNEITLEVETCEDIERLENIYNENKSLQSIPAFGQMINRRKGKLLTSKKIKA